MKWDSEKEQKFSLKSFLNQNSSQDDKLQIKKSKATISLSKSRSRIPKASSPIKTELKEEYVYIKSEETEDICLDSLMFNTSSDLKQVRSTQQTKEETSVDFETPNDSLKTEYSPRTDYSILNIPDNNPADHTYHCPLCQKDLTDVKSSYLRQKHIDACMIPHQPQESEFDHCVFCGQSLVHYNPDQKQVHLNRCLDGSTQESRQDTFAGQPVPFLSELDICPVCHEFGPVSRGTVKQKIGHIKQCSKERRVGLDELLKKFQWIGWGHRPVPALSSDPTPVSSQPKYEYIAYIQDETSRLDNDDGAFDQHIHVHKRFKSNTKSRREDKNNEELQTVLALSKSLKEVESLSRRKERIKPTDERDWNSANIISMEESKLKAISKLDELLFPNELNTHPKIFEPKLGTSKLANGNLYFWNLSSNRDNNWSNPNVFKSLFLQNLYNRKTTI